MNGAGPDEDERQEQEDAGPDVARDHQRHPRVAIGEPAEDRFADESCRGPRRGDDPERREVDAVLA